jgi:hypothetical protein
VILSNRNSWRVERADRAAVLIDAASYFGALRKSLIKARSTVFWLGGTSIVARDSSARTEESLLKRTRGKGGEGSSER